MASPTVLARANERASAAPLGTRRTPLRLGTLRIARPGRRARVIIAHRAVRARAARRHIAEAPAHRVGTRLAQSITRSAGCEVASRCACGCAGMIASRLFRKWRSGARACHLERIGSQTHRASYVASQDRCRAAVRRWIICVARSAACPRRQEIRRRRPEAAAAGRRRTRPRRMGRPKVRAPSQIRSRAPAAACPVQATTATMAKGSGRLAVPAHPAAASPSEADPEPAAPVMALAARGTATVMATATARRAPGLPTARASPAATRATPRLRRHLRIRAPRAATAGPLRRREERRASYRHRHRPASRWSVRWW